MTPFKYLSPSLLFNITNPSNKSKLSNPERDDAQK